MTRAQRENKPIGTLCGIVMRVATSRLFTNDMMKRRYLPELSRRRPPTGAVFSLQISLEMLFFGKRR